MVEQLYDATPSNGKRKRGKAMSVTPSLNGDDDEDRDAVCFVNVEPQGNTHSLLVPRNVARQRSPKHRLLFVRG